MAQSQDLRLNRWGNIHRWQEHQNLQLASLRKYRGLVQQDIYLFAGTVLDNIRYGNLEATSSLDNDSEKAVQDALEKLIETRTTIVIAHRLSTIRNAKRILVLTDNGIKEPGTHKELLELNGVYANLYNMQLRVRYS